MTNPIVEKINEWLFSIALKKASYFIVKLVIGFVAGVKVAPILSQLGITIDPDTMTAGLTGFIGGGLTILQNWLKVKYKLTWL